MEIDLGDEIKIKVKYATKEYSLREPTVSEVQKLSESDKKSFDAVTEFLEVLGLPRDIISGMGVSKASKLVDGLTDMLVKKR